MGHLLQELLLVFTSVLFIVDPFAVIPSFLAMTERDTPATRRVLARRGAWTAAITLTLFALAGSLIFKVFGITIGAFKIAGGVLIGLNAHDMVQARRGTAARPDGHAHSHPADGARAVRDRGAVHHRRHQALRSRGLVTRPVRVALILLGASPLAAQRPSPWIRWGAQAIPAFT